MQLDRERTALAAFITGTVLAGGNAVGVRFSNRELDPFWGAGVRFVLALCSRSRDRRHLRNLRERVGPVSLAAGRVGRGALLRAGDGARAPLPSRPPVVQNAVGMATGAAILLVLSLLAQESLVVPERGATWLALA